MPPLLDLCLLGSLVYCLGVTGILINRQSLLAELAGNAYLLGACLAGVGVVLFVCIYLLSTPSRPGLRPLNIGGGRVGVCHRLGVSRSLGAHGRKLGRVADLSYEGIALYGF